MQSFRSFMSEYLLLKESQDNLYLDLAKDPVANSEQLQELVQDAAKKEGYDVKAYHQGKESHTVFRDEYKTELSPFGFHFGTEEQAKFRAGQYDYVGGNGAYLGKFNLSLNKPLRVNHMSSYSTDWLAELMIDNDIITDTEYESILEQEDFYTLDVAKKMVLILKKNGYDGLVYENDKEGEGDSYVPFDSNQIKSADPITYDESGNIIPLSKRFDPSTDNINY